MECDGRELALPRDTEGLIIMNIPSYMGGVDLWASGRPAPAAITAAGFTDAGPQSMSDQRLEVRCCSLWIYDVDMHFRVWGLGRPCRMWKSLFW